MEPSELTEEEKERYRNLMKNHIIGITYHDVALQLQFSKKMREYYNLRIEVFSQALEKMTEPRDYKSRQAKDE
jgi:hypothetical protein